MNQKINGNQDFEGPDEQEIDEYLEKSQKSLSRMEKGGDPLYFRSKKRTSSSFRSKNLMVLTIIFLIILPSAILISSQMANNIPSNPGTNDTDDDTNIPTEPITYDDLNTEQLLRNLKNRILSEMMNNLTGSPIKILLIEGNPNTYVGMSNQTYLDMMWLINTFYNPYFKEDVVAQLFSPDLNPYLTRFENNSLKISYSSTISTPDELNEQLKLLRLFLSFNPADISVEFLEQIESIWNVTSSYYNQNVGIFCMDTENSTLHSLDSQLIALDCINLLWEYDSYYSLNQTKLFAMFKDAINLLDNIERLGLVPRFFYANQTSSERIYYLSDQTNIYLTLSRLLGSSLIYDNDLSRYPVSNLMDKLNFDTFRTKNWSYKEAISIKTLRAFGDIKTQDQFQMVLIHVKEEHLNAAKYIIETTLTILASEYQPYFQISNVNMSIGLLDQIVAISAINSIEWLESTILDTGLESNASSFVGWILPIALFILYLTSSGTRNRKKKDD